MRDGNGNQFAGPVPLRGANGRPLGEKPMTAGEKSTVQALTDARAETDRVRDHFEHMAQAINEAHASDAGKHAEAEAIPVKSEEGEPFPLEPA